MDKMNVNNKNLIDKYQPSPAKYFDIEGRLTKKDGKNISIEREVGSESLVYNLRLKEEISNKLGEKIEIKKEDIVSLSLEKSKEIREEDEEEANLILEDFNMEASEENSKLVARLLHLGIKPSKENIESYKQSKMNLMKIIENVDTDSIIALMEKDVDFQDINLQDASDILEEVKTEGDSFSLRELLNIDKELSYKEAELISKKIYGQKMGRDIYDIIIALDRENIEINRENIDDALEVMSKLNDLKNIEDESLIEIIGEDLELSINNLYKIKNNYNSKSLSEVDQAGVFEDFTIVKEVDLESLTQLMEELEIEVNQENIGLARSFILEDMNLDREKFQELKDMRLAIETLRESIDERKLVNLLDRGMDLLNENIYDIIDELDRLEELEEPESSNIDGPREISDKEFELLESLDRIGEEELLDLIRSGRDFNLSNIRELESEDLKPSLDLDYKVLDMSKVMVDAFASIGERPDSQTIAYSISKDEALSLENLYESSKFLSENKIEIESPESEIEDALVNEYMRARKNLSTQLIRDSIIEDKDIYRMELKEFNRYTESRINRYKKAESLTEDLRSIASNKEIILPLIMKNELDMTLKEIGNIDSYLRGDKGLSREIERFLKTGPENPLAREEIRDLQKSISDSLREGSKSLLEDYNRLMAELDLSSDSNSSKRESDGDRDFREIQKRISRKNTVLQLPVEIDGDFSDLNIIIPSRAKDLNPGDMKFSINLYTDNLESVNMDVRLLGRDLYIDLSNPKLLDKISLLDKSLEEIGYNLKLVDQNEE